MIQRSGKIKYMSGMKYSLRESYWVQTDILPEKECKSDYVRLLTNGVLLIMSGFSWDGPSGITFDSKDSMSAAIVHDALYRLMQEESLDRKWKYKADNLFYDMLIEDGMWEWRAKIWYAGVRDFGEQSTIERKKLHSAP